MLNYFMNVNFANANSESNATSNPVSSSASSALAIAATPSPSPNPSPASKLRPFAPDRPSSTNNPYTIDPGHVQLEVEAINLSRTQLNYPNPNLRIGLTHLGELDFAWVPLLTQKTGPQNLTGMGDLNLRWKQNLIGDDQGNSALALMPGIKIPTNTDSVGNSKFEPTLMIPYSTGLPFAFGLNLMPEYDLRKNLLNDSFHSELNFPITVGHRLFGRVGEYVEYVIHSNFDPAVQGAGTIITHYIGLGVAPKFGKNMQFDLGANIGLNAETPPIAFFAGFVIRP
jgi:hypothetical protein